MQFTLKMLIFSPIAGTPSALEFLRQFCRYGGGGGGLLVLKSFIVFEILKIFNVVLANSVELSEDPC